MLFGSAAGEVGDRLHGRPARTRTRTDEVGARRASAYTTGLQKRTTRIERASPGWRPVPFHLSYVREKTPGWSRTSGLCCRRAALCPLSYRRQEGASGRNRTRTSAVQRARVAVDTTEARVETAGVEPAPPRCKRGALPPELHPQKCDARAHRLGWRRAPPAPCEAQSIPAPPLRSACVPLPARPRSVSAVAYEERIAVTNEPNGRRLATLFEPRSVPLDRRRADTSRSPIADPRREPTQRSL